MGHLMLNPLYRLYDARFNGIHFCSGNNMTEQQLEQMEHDEEDFDITERAEE